MKMPTGIRLTNEDLQLSLYAFFDRYCGELGWVPKTIEQYRRYIRMIDHVLGSPPFEEIDEPTVQEAVQKVRMSSKRKSGFSDRTLEMMVGIFRDLCRFAERCSDGLYFDVCANEKWRVPKAAEKKPLAQRTKADIARERKAQIQRATRLPRSLTILQEQHLVRQLTRHYARRGSYMALALMLYLGLRPSECLGLTFGDIRPLYGHEDQIRCIYVYKQRKQDEAVDYRLKTHNAYRILPIPSELDALLRQREKGMRTRLDGDISEYPIVCKDTKWSTPCKRRTALELCAGLLRKEFKDEEVIADLTAEMNRDTAFEEKDITSYLLRRNFATAMISVCGMEEDELQYLMGHEILDEQEVRSDFTDADFLARIWRKMNRRVLREDIPDEEKPIIVDQGECVAEGRSTMVVEVAEECFQDGNEAVVLDLWNELPGDFISVRPNEQGDAREDDITIDASYEPVQPQKADRIDIAQDYCAAVQRVRKSSRKNKHPEDAE